MPQEVVEEADPVEEVPEAAEVVAEVVLPEASEEEPG